MSAYIIRFSDDQAEAFDGIAAALLRAGVDLDNARTLPRDEGAGQVVAVLGKAGSGKTMLLAKIVDALGEAGVETVSPDYTARRKSTKRTLAA